MLILALALFNVWFILSGNTSVFLLGCGAASALFAAFFARPKNNINIFGATAYCFWILKESLVSAYNMLRKTCSANYPSNVQFDIVVVPKKQGRELREEELLIAILALSITVTPGTVTSGIGHDDQALSVASFDKEIASDLNSGFLQEQIEKYFGSA